MRFEEKEIRAKDGSTWVLRNCRGTDAQSMLAYLKQVSGETPFLLRNPDEVNFTLEEEIALLENKLEEEGCFMMLAVKDGIVAGNCGVSGKSSLRRVRHRCSFGIALKKEYWNLGLGKALMEYATEIASLAGYQQMELEVTEGNETARAMYEKHGFVETGYCPNAIRYDDGSSRGEYTMVKVL